MRTSTVSEHKTKVIREPCLPRKGTSVREVYDMLYKYRGKKVPMEERSVKWRKYASIIKNLEHFWGCDIRKGALVGECYGKVYIDYTKEAQDEALIQDQSNDRIT